MSDPKPFASLSSGLLARKGAARPAMRPQGFGQAGAGLDDLGWNDMGFEAPKAAAAERDSDHDAFGQDVVEHPRALNSTGLSPIESPVHSQQAEIVDRLYADSAEEPDETFDEEFDETAEPYDPDAPFVAAEDEEEDEEADESFDAPVAAFDPQPSPAPFAPKKKMMALDTPPAVESEPAAEAVDMPVEALLSEPVAIAPQPEPMVVAAAPATPKPRRVSRPRALAGQKGKAAFTLRLDPERHLKLRLACAVDGRSAQMLVTQALDQLLSAMPELQDMAEKANRKG